MLSYKQCIVSMFFGGASKPLILSSTHFHTPFWLILCLDMFRPHLFLTLYLCLKGLDLTCISLCIFV